MTRLWMVVFIVSLLSIAQADASPIRAADPMGGTGGGPISGTLQVRVVVDGTTDPIEGAFVMVGLIPGGPFENNWGYTSATGDITFTDPALTGPVSVTAGATDYRYFTLVSVNADDIVLALKPLDSQNPTYEVGDYVSGIDVDNGLFHAGDGNVDMAFVLPSLTMNDLIAFDLDVLIGPPEIISVLGNDFEVPSNMFIPQQWEVFVEIIKDHYYLYLPAGDYTIAAMSGRIPVNDLLNTTEMVDLIAALDWREIDIIDVTVTGNTNSADLNVGPDLNETVTLNLANVPEDSVAFCISIGDLDALNGSGRLISMGLSALDAPAGGGPASGTVNLTTTAATGEFAGMEYHPVVAVQMNQSEDLLVITDRTTHSQTYTETLNNFFDLLDLAYTHGRFSWNDVENPGTGSPEVDLQIARIADSDTGAVYWEFMIPGHVQTFFPAFPPEEAPADPASGTAYVWDHVSLGLDFNLATFDFNNFSFSDITDHGSHVSVDSASVVWPWRLGIKHKADRDVNAFPSADL